MSAYTVYADPVQASASSSTAALSSANGSLTATAPTAPTSSSTTTTTTPSAGDSQVSTSGQSDDLSKKKKATKRRKVNHACLYCRRSHMTCDEGRPCQRCIKREIGHLCHDERRPKPTDKPPANPVSTVDMTRSFAPVTVYQAPPPQPAQPAPSPWSITTMAQNQFLYQPSDTLGNEFSVLTDFLETLDEGSFFTPPSNINPTLVSSASFPNTSNISTDQTSSSSLAGAMSQPISATSATAPPPGMNGGPSPDAASVSSSASGSASTTDSVLPSATKTERFLLTAADQESGTRNERLNRVIRSKYEAGLLKPYNYVKGYARLSRWMDRNVSQESKQQILQPLSVLRPKFRAVAQSLRDIDLVFIEEAFERLLLDYDRVFSAMAVPACLWRRTGEIYKGNREFSELVGVDGYMLRDGRLCIYELMAEESAVNYWEKYGHVAFDSTQKAVLTSCVLRYKPCLNSGSTSPTSASALAAKSKQLHLQHRSQLQQQQQQQSLLQLPDAQQADDDGGSGSASASGSTDPTSPSAATMAAAGTALSSLSGSAESTPPPTEEGFLNCCFSFTIRRDKWGIPTMIVGNFIKC